MKLSSNEIYLLDKVFAGSKILTVERKSERDFDLLITGTKETESLGKNDFEYNFSSWLPLATIDKANWIDFAEKSDYPAMVRDGDWSGIRDSSEDKIWAMFSLAESYI